MFVNTQPVCYDRNKIRFRVCTNNYFLTDLLKATMRTKNKKIAYLYNNALIAKEVLTLTDLCSNFAWSSPTEFDIHIKHRAYSGVEAHRKTASIGFSSFDLDGRYPVIKKSISSITTTMGSVF